MYLVTLILQTGFYDDLTCHTKFFLSTLVKGTLKRNMLLLASLSKDIPCDGKATGFECEHHDPNRLRPARVNGGNFVTSD